MNRIIKLIPITAIALTAVSCGGEKKEEENKDAKQEVKIEKDTTSTTESPQRVDFDEVFSDVPSPITMARILKFLDAETDESVFHNPDDAANYTNEQKQALNLGVFGVDLNYINVVGPKGKSIEYMAATLHLTEKLGMDAVIDETVAEKYKANEDNTDSLIAIFNDTYYDIETYLKSNNRESIAAFMMAGGVVEALHLATSLPSDKEKMKQVIADHKESVKSIVKLMEKVGDNDETHDIITDLSKISSILEKSQETKSLGTNDHNESGELLIGATSTTVISDEIMDELKTVVSEIRAKYISL